MTAFKTIKSQLSVLAKVAVPLVIVGLAIGIPAQAASTTATSAAAPGAQRPAMIAPLAGAATLTAAQAVTAAQECASYATRAGWANNGYYSGDLVTATAVCVAESGGDPRVYVCDDSGGNIVGSGDYDPTSVTPVNCPIGTTVSYDRGLWQLNSVAASTVNDSCAFNPVCNAGKAYSFSNLGTRFSPWASYDQDSYARQIDPAQAAVTALTSGTVTSALLGECLVQSKSAAGAKVVIADCGSGGTTQQWKVTGGKLRSGSVCASVSSVTSTTAGVVLRKCAPLKVQQWVAYGRDELRNVAAGKCLTDPNNSLTAGTAVVVTACANAKNQVWWLP